MAGRIRVLDENVINRIAAGEVVERPVSVVKELMENSIDAGASSIQVEIEQGGRKLIRVRDNGSGMSHDDAFLALERHATSKITTEKDLTGIGTMGFRGEALASIASVSRLRLVTREESDPAGTEIVIEGGVLRKSERIGAGVGTLVEVRSLFYNVPVRRKFLKVPGIEAGHIQELVTRLGLAFPTIGVTYSEDGRLKLDAPPVRTTYERIHTLYSKDVRENLVEIDHKPADARLSGFVARPPYARSNMRSVLTFVNGRVVRDRLVNAAVTRAFSNLIERGRYPLAILFIELPADQLDVNVHPQKAEVRFVNPRMISDLILDGIHQSLMGAPFRSPETVRESVFPRPTTTPPERHGLEERLPEEPAEFVYATAPQAGFSPPSASPPGPETESAGRYSSLRVLGQVPGSFLILYSNEELIFMDHHAAHERLLFEDLLTRAAQGSRFPSQTLLIPRVVSFSPLEARTLAAHLDILQDAGFQIEEFGDADFMVRGVPTWVDDTRLEEFFLGLIDVMFDSGLRGDPNRFREELFKRMACSKAVKATERLEPEEVRALLRDLDRSKAPEVCPHGRPLTVPIPLSEIRKKMGRK